LRVVTMIQRFQQIVTQAVDGYNLGVHRLLGGQSWFGHPLPYPSPYGLFDFCYPFTR
jgi:hypothetical protein